MKTDRCDGYLGKVTAFGTDEDSGADVGVSLQLGDDIELWCGEISRAAWEEAGTEKAELGGPFGWWIILYAKGKTTVVGKAVDRYVADEMVARISMALRQPAKRGGKEVA